MSLQDVLSILVELDAMEQDSLRILPLGLVARGINCNNELWMAAAVTHPDVMSLTPPQLAAFVGALQCTDLLKRPMSIWSSFQVRPRGQRGRTTTCAWTPQLTRLHCSWRVGLSVPLTPDAIVGCWERLRLQSGRTHNTAVYCVFAVCAV